MDSKDTRQALIKTGRSFKMTIPILIGVLILVSLLITVIPPEFYIGLFTGNVITDSIVGALFGSIAAGNPINSYIIGGELMVYGISMFAITAFIVAWVTVGAIQLPAEGLMLGKRFALVRNAVSFVLSIVVAILTVITLGLL